MQAFVSDKAKQNGLAAAMAKFNTFHPRECKNDQ
jgi:hypothetical protein